MRFIPFINNHGCARQARARLEMGSSSCACAGFHYLTCSVARPSFASDKFWAVERSSKSRRVRVRAANDEPRVR